MATGKILIIHVACLIFLLDSAGIYNNITSFPRDKKWISWTGMGLRSWLESNERLHAGDPRKQDSLLSSHPIPAEAFGRIYLWELRAKRDNFHVFYWSEPREVARP